MEHSEGAYEYEAHNVQSFTHHVSDMEGRLWSLVQELKRIDDELKPYGLSAPLMYGGELITLEFFLELRDE